MSSEPTRGSAWERRRLRLPLLAAALSLAGVVATALPSGQPEVALPTEPTPFRWDADALFGALEAEFDRASETTETEAEATVQRLTEEHATLLGALERSSRPPADGLARLATLQFELAVQGAAHPALLPAVSDVLTRTRIGLMDAAVAWPTTRATHEALYRVLLGGRIALEEALVQAGLDALPALLPVEDVPSATPSLEVEGVRIHSGDILLSRGGAPTSALIARGNDFPNAFSHAALAYVDTETGEGTVIESLIEAGSVTHSVAEYLESQKHRILVLRLRPDHPALAGDPLLPHQAARAMLERVRAEHLPYDFPMAWQDPSAAFCSEIIFHAYRGEGVDLWTLRSPMSTAGLTSWLAAMGVREFTTLVPSDLEYDPQVRAVAEWRDAPALMEYRLDNAITDALLEEAERGSRLGFPWYALPFARALKAYSVVVDALGGTPSIPAGMSASTALRVDALVSHIHPAVKGALEGRARSFEEERGYPAPYWQLVALAREALAEIRPTLATALRAP